MSSYELLEIKDLQAKVAAVQARMSIIEIKLGVDGGVAAPASPAPDVKVNQVDPVFKAKQGRCVMYRIKIYDHFRTFRVLNLVNSIFGEVDLKIRKLLSDVCRDHPEHLSDASWSIVKEEDEPSGEAEALEYQELKNLLAKFVLGLP
jgi:hypothetical protein